MKLTEGIPRLIVCHIADGSYEGTKAWFQQSASQTSSHFILAQDGRVCQCVPLSRMAWCNGTTTAKTDSRYFGLSTVPLVKELGGNANQYSVSIECEGMYSKTKGALTDAQLDALVQLIQDIRDEVKEAYGHAIPLTRDCIVGHNEITPKTRPHCPGELFPWDALMQRLQGENAGKTLYCVMQQVGAFSSKEAAEREAMARRSQEPGAYWFVQEKVV